MILPFLGKPIKHTKICKTSIFLTCHWPTAIFQGLVASSFSSLQNSSRLLLKSFVHCFRIKSCLPISSRYFHFIYPENTRKSLVFGHFLRIQNGNIGQKQNKVKQKNSQEKTASWSYSFFKTIANLGSNNFG